MEALGGWFGLLESGCPPAAILGTMAGALRGRRLRDASSAGPGAAAWISAAAPRQALCAAEEPLVAIVGRPRWRDPQLAEEQRARGVAWALRHAYRAHGIGLFERIAGPFAFAVLDPANRQALLAVDRLGIHSLYYAQPDTEGLVFGTTADMVRAHPRVGASISLQAVYGYLQAFVCRSPGTIYREQRKLGPAQYLLWRNGESRVIPYWRMTFEPDRARGSDELAEELVSQVRRAVRKAVPNGEAAHTGAFLSGGLDSSTVVGMLSEVTPGPAETFTIGFDDAHYDEMRYAEATNARFGTKAHRYYLTADDAAETVPKIATYYDEPFGNSSALPAYYCAAKAREAGVSCLLAGDGGDEILAGNSRYLEHTRPGPLQRMPAPLRATLKLAAFHTPLLRNAAIWRKVQGRIRRAEAPLPERLDAYNFYQLERLPEVFAPEVLRELDLEAPWREMRQTYAEAAASEALQRMMHLDLKWALADSDLKKVTGMCDLAGIDVRFPLLDEDLVAFCASIPPELHLKDDRLRAFFKDAFRDFLPEAVIAKKKHGFGMPVHEWTRDHPGLRELTFDCLGRMRRRHLVRSDFIDRLIAEHDRPERTPYSGLAWDYMMLELWLDSHGF